VAAHVFERPGTYNVSVTASYLTYTTTNGTVQTSVNTATVQNIQVTVDDPDVVFAGTKTVCIANNTAAAGSGGCPMGAATPPGTSDFYTALQGCIGTGKRCLFKRGDTFVSGTPVTVQTAGPATIGAYGSGALPVITSTNITGVLRPSAGVSDLRIMDLKITGSGITDTGIGISVMGGVIEKLTILRLTIGGAAGSNIGEGIIMQSGTRISNSVIQDSTISYVGNYVGMGVAIFGGVQFTGIMGNLLGPMTDGATHTVRLQNAINTSFTNNTVLQPGVAGMTALTIRALEHLTAPNPDTRYVYVGDNIIDGGTKSAQIFQVAPAGTDQNNWVSDVIVERNRIKFGSNGYQGFITEGVRITVRNNICDASSGGAASRLCFYVAAANTVGAPNPDDIRILNNTCYNGGSNPTFYCVFIDANATKAITGTQVVNNLGYAPSVPTTVMLGVLGTTVTGTIGGSGTYGNSSNAQMKSTNPDFINASGSFSTPLDFKLPSSDSYAIGSGIQAPVWSDFFLAPTFSPPDIGAVNH